MRFMATMVYQYFFFLFHYTNKDLRSHRIFIKHLVHTKTLVYPAPIVINTVRPNITCNNNKWLKINQSKEIEINGDIICSCIKDLI